MKPKSALRTAAAGPQEFSEPGTAGLECLRDTAPRPNLKRILVAIDFSPCSVRALDYALLLAEAFEATIILLHVLEPEGFSGEYLGMPAEREQRLQTHVEAERERLSEIHRRRVGQRVGSETLVRIGRAWSEIPDTAQAMAADLIVVGAHGHSHLRNAPLGSTAEGVLRHAHCPVLTVTSPAP